VAECWSSALSPAHRDQAGERVTQSRIAPSITTALELPRIVRLGRNLFGAAFTLMKLLPARHILDRAERSGKLEPGTVVIETTSGTFGLALAMECSLRGYPLILVSDPVIDPAFRRRLQDLGTEVIMVEEPTTVGGYQQARLERVAQLCGQYRRHFLPCQYGNPDHPGAYRVLAEALVEALGPLDCLVGPVGSGGSMCGTAASLRQRHAELRAVAVDTPGSVLFGQVDRPRRLRGLGNSIMPANLDHPTFDEVHWVSDREAFAATRALHRRHALFMGPTSGAAWLVAEWWARTHPEARVLTLLPDEGHRYQDTIYDDAWLSRAGLRLRRLPSRPVEVSRPAQAGPEWSWLRWGRRPYGEVVVSDDGPELDLTDVAEVAEVVATPAGRSAGALTPPGPGAAG
jgi:cysteine synthase